MVAVTTTVATVVILFLIVVTLVLVAQVKELTQDMIDLKYDLQMRRIKLREELQSLKSVLNNSIDKK